MRVMSRHVNFLSNWSRSNSDDDCPPPRRLTTRPAPLGLGGGLRRAEPRPAPPQAGCAARNSCNMIGHSAVISAGGRTACARVLCPPPSPRALAGPQPSVSSSSPGGSFAQRRETAASEWRCRESPEYERDEPRASTQSLVMVSSEGLWTHQPRRFSSEGVFSDDTGYVHIQSHQVMSPIEHQILYDDLHSGR